MEKGQEILFLENLGKELSDLEQRKFMLNMKDNWDEEDWKLDRELDIRISELIPKIEHMREYVYGRK